MEFRITSAATGFRLEHDGSDFETHEGLETAIQISLFTDARVEADELPSWETEKRGWWGDLFSSVPGDRTGSKLWLLAREKRLEDVPPRAEEYCREALAWLIEDGVAESIEVDVEIQGQILAIGVTVKRPNAGDIRFSYQYAWNAQAKAGGA